MKAIIFAGGHGTRLWPLSRRNSPKQFEKVIGDKSTLQLAIERLVPDFSWKDIFVATNQHFKTLVTEQLPLLPSENVIGEPEMRDVGPAVGLVTATLYKRFGNEPIVILWCDHLIKNVELFRKILSISQREVLHRKDTIIFISQKPRFPSQNLGWVHFGKTLFERADIAFRSFGGFAYRPTLEKAEEFFKKGGHSWNLGYFVTTLGTIWKLYKEHQPEMFSVLKRIYDVVDTTKFKSVVEANYSSLPKVSFDNAILEHIDSKHALVVTDDLGWSDVGAWEALKEALQQSPEQNVIQGKVLVTDCQDSLIYNYTDQLVAAIDLNGFIVINTNDVTFVCHKNSVPKIKKLVERLANSENEHLV
jgi:mannose-1-phosphate guanylyltransferase